MKQLLGALAGFATFVVVGSIPNMLGNYKGWAALFVLFVGPAAGFAMASYVIAHFASQEAEVARLAREEARKAAEDIAEKRRLQDEVERATTRGRQLVSEARGAALSLPTGQAEAEIDLDRAETELTEGRYSPFWEAVEDATSKLNCLAQDVSLIEDRRAEYAGLASRFGSVLPVFSIGVAVLPDPAPTHKRLTGLYRKAQKDPHFANIYEQRRIAAKVDRTNAILIAGFSSLGQAIERLGDRTEEAIGRLSADLDCRLGNIQSSLEAAASAAAEQNRALLAELSRSEQHDHAALQQLRQDAASRADSERMTRRMLDNIQRRRKPSMWDTP